MPASAQTTRYVGSGQPYPAIQAAINAASNGDIISIGDAVITEKSINVNKDNLAMDRGSNPLNLLYDQRGIGFSRVKHGRADIGAFEYGAGPAKGIVVTVR